ncbi:Kelch-like protein diablo [Pseudolycoriella hygida]|uniref:Kelch-like protein diablo n=1 Tax=Pseudolycoriella hygida TaxID=35572 RepID=A0A9Q0MJS1_9DIPT|nr:Kelch-like protein diablo [Pseudolycoriella hygida]
MTVAKSGKLMHAKRFAGVLLNNLNKQRDDSKLCDVEFVIGSHKKKITAHRCIMSAASPYFTAMFASNFNEAKQREVIIQDVNADDFELLIEFCYTATIHITNENAKRLLQAAHCFQFTDVINACCQYLKGQMDPSTSLGIANLAEYLDLKDLYKSAMEFTYENFAAVSKYDEFLLLDIQMLSNLLLRNDLVVRAEDDVFRAMLAWIRYDVEDRSKFTNDLLKMIRLTHLNIASTIDDLKNLSPTVENKDLLIDALICQLVPQRRREIENYGVSTKSRKYTDEGKIIAIGNRNFLTEKTAIEIFHPGDKKWMVVRTFNKRLNFAATIMNNKLVIAGGQGTNGEILNSVLMYDLKTFELAKLPPMIERRFSFEVCFLDGYLYAVGGRTTKTVERFCFNENVWRFIPPLVPQRSCFSAIVYNNRLYIVGGKIGENGPSLNRVDYFDPTKNKWTLGTPTAFDRIRPALSEDKGFLYVYSSNSLERYDPSVNSWMVRSIHTVPTFSRRYHYRFLLNTSLILIGQNDEVEVDENSVEVEEFEEIEDEEDDETTADGASNEGINMHFVSQNNEPPTSLISTIEREVNQDPQPRNVQLSYDEFDENYIKRYCLETGTITQLPLMNVIRKIEFFIQIPNEN